MKEYEILEHFLQNYGTYLTTVQTNWFKALIKQFRKDNL